MADMWIAVANGALTLLTAYLGVHITMHPARTNRAKTFYKVAFVVCGLVICVLIALQTLRAGKAQEVFSAAQNKLLADHQILLNEMKQIERRQLTESNVPQRPPLPETSKRPSVKSQPDRKPSITQNSSGDCSPNIVGSGNETTCAPTPKLTATRQLQQQMPNGEWLTSFTVSPNVLVQSGDLRLLCDGPVLRAVISRIDPFETSTGTNGPNASNQNEAVYQLKPQIISPGQVVTIGVYSPAPVHVISGSLGQQAIIFSK
jgi:hypothetical protein